MNSGYNKVSPVVSERSEIKVKIRTRKGKLYVDYYVEGKRLRRSTGLADNAANRKLVKDRIIPQIQAKILLGEYGKKISKPLKEYAMSYLHECEALASYDSKAKMVQVIIKELGSRKIDRVTRADVKRFVNSFSDRPHIAKKYLTMLKGIFMVAIDEEVIVNNPANNVKPPKALKPKVDPFSPEEVQALMEASTGMLHDFLGIAFNTGLRSGEILGLMRSDIGHDSIDIRRAVTRGKVGETKTVGSVRKIPLFNVIKPYIENRMKESKSLFLFDKEGGHLGDVGYFRRAWKTAMKKSGVRYRKIYNTRHTFITAMLNSGRFSVLQIAQMVGHATPRMIMTTYAGYIKSEHLRIDVDTDLFGHNTGTQGENADDGEKGKSSGSA